jgi:general secretion pathway protein A
MYTSFFGLHEKPFSITPDPRYLFMSERHGEALAHLVYGVTESGGFMQLTGEVGTGKTTLVRTLLLNRMPANADVAVVLNPQLSAREFLVTICEELHLPVPAERDSIKALIDALNRHLLSSHAKGRRTILVVDEAQNLAAEVLEQVRLLTNLETARQKLLQIVLIGQPELRELLGRNDLRQLAQRITGRYHLEPLSRADTDRYIEHRLKVAGALGEIFSSSAKREVYRLSQGVPRLINVICDRALLGAYAAERRRVERGLVQRAAAEVTGKTAGMTWLRWALTTAGIAVAVIVGASFLSMLNERRLPPEIADNAPAAAVEAPVPASGADSVADPVQDETSLDEELRLADELTSTDTALSTLFGLWGLTYERGGPNGCGQAESAGYACFEQRGAWSSLKQFNRPAVLKLVDHGGNTHRVVVTSVTGDYAELSIGGVLVTHPVEEVSDLWFGQYLLLWRPPNGISQALGPGSRGTNVVWLRQSLAAIDPRYETTSPDSEVYDNELQGKVRDFQRDNRLAVDGLAGQQTQIIINSLLAPDETPRLTVPRLAQE